MFTTLFIPRLRSLAIALLAALAIAGATATIAASSQIQHSHVAAMRWCQPGSPGCAAKVAA